MNRIPIALVSVLLLTSSTLAAPASPEGVWQLPSGARVAIAPCADALCGQVTVPAARQQQGQPILRDLRINGDVWRGKVWAEQLKDWADVEVTRNGTALNLKACAMMACRNREWQQAAP